MTISPMVGSSFLGKPLFIQPTFQPDFILKTSAGFDEAVTSLPCFLEARPYTRPFSIRAFGFPALLRIENGAGIGKAIGFPLGEFKQLAIAEEIGNAEVGKPGLTGAEELPGAAHRKVELSQLKSILGADHGIETLFGEWGNAFAGYQNAVAFRCAAADASAQLMQLRKAETLGMLHDHYGCIGNVDAHFNHGGSDEHIDLSALESAHDDFFFVRVETSVQQAKAQSRQRAGAQLLVHFDG